MASRRLIGRGEMLVIYRHLVLCVQVGSLFEGLLEVCRDGLEARCYQVPCGIRSQTALNCLESL